MNSKICFFILSSWIVLMISCEAVVVDDAKIPGGTFLIGTLLISPETEELTAGVSHLLPAQEVNTGTSLIIENARVVLTNLKTSEQKRFSYDRIGQRYTLNTDDFPIKQREQYRLEITSDTHKMTGECYIPRHARHIRLRRLYDAGDTWYADISLRDVRGEQNSYHLAVFLQEDSPDNLFGDPPPAIRITPWDFGALIIDDEHDGEEYKLRLEIERDIEEYIRTHQEGTRRVKYIELYVLTSDWNYYNYQKAVFEDDDINPLFGEPKLLPKGFDNGYGIFSGYRVQTRKYSLDQLIEDEDS